MPSDIDLDNLIGRRVWASIGEPWDFSSDAGENRLEGEILETCAPSEQKGWILCGVSAFKDSGLVIGRVAATRRYAGSGTIVEEILNRGSVGVNLLYVVDGTVLSSTRVRELLANGTGASYLVGTLYLA